MMKSRYIYIYMIIICVCYSIHKITHSCITHLLTSETGHLGLYFMFSCLGIWLLCYINTVLYFCLSCFFCVHYLDTLWLLTHPYYYLTCYYYLCLHFFLNVGRIIYLYLKRIFSQLYHKLFLSAFLQYFQLYTNPRIWNCRPEAIHKFMYSIMKDCCFIFDSCKTQE